MKKIYILLGILLLTSCATVAPLSYQEHCAVQGMKFTGVRQTSGGTTVYAQGSNGSYANAYASSNSESVDCVVPTSDIDKCEIKNAQNSAIPKADYNDSIGTKRLVNGTGYVLFIIPGIIAKMAFDDVRGKAIDQSRKIASEQKPCY